MRDYYDVLGVDRDADQKTITKAYKALAKRLHPDVNPSAGAVSEDRATASDELRDVIEAYQVISKPDKRASYDGAWQDSRARLNRRIVLAAVIVMAGSVTAASLAMAYFWRAELLAERGMAETRPAPGVPHAVPPPKLAKPAVPPPKIASRPARRAPLSTTAGTKRTDLPSPRTATPSPGGILKVVAGPARVARAVPALWAPKVEEVTKFAIIKTADAVFSPEPHRIAATDVPRPLARSGEATAGKVADAEKFLPLPERPPSGARDKKDAVFTKQQAAALISRWYLSSGGRDRRTLHTLYCPRVDYWGQRAAQRAAVIDQITQFAGRWPRRAYKLRPGSLKVSQTGRPRSYRADFEYEFSVSGLHGFDGAAGLASGRLVMERRNGRWRICAEDGRVLKRRHPYPGAAGGNASKYASSQRMDPHRTLFGE